ncbi:RuvB-like protein 2 [Tanacetum coccineum]
MVDLPLNESLAEIDVGFGVLMDIVVVDVVGVVVVVVETLVLFDCVVMDGFEVVVVDGAGTLHGSDVIDPFEHVREIFIPSVFITGHRNRNTLALIPTNTNTWFSCHQIHNHTQKTTFTRFKRKIDVDISDDVKVLLTKIRVETSLRYAINLITSAALACLKRKGKVVEMEDVSRVYELFWDVK